MKMRNQDQEMNIVWLTPPDALPRYIRQASQVTGRRRGRPRFDRPGQLVAYAELGPDTPNDGTPGSFTRRYFYLAPHDPYEGSGAPIEAVDPITVTPGQGRLTERAWGGPLG